MTEHESGRARGPKKTDAIEVRLSWEEKAKLRQTAAQAGLTISALIRARLQDVLTESEPEPARGGTGRLFMARMLDKTQKFLTARPRVLALAGAVLVGCIALAAAPSHAQTMRMNYAAEIAHTAQGAPSISTGSAEQGISEPLEIDIRDPSAGRYHIRLIAQPVSDSEALVSSEIAHFEGATRTVLGAQGILVRYGEQAAIRIGGGAAPEISLRVRIAKPG